jgi:hypothetical protein
MHISTWVLINEVIGKRPNSDLAEILHDVLLSPTIVLQYLVCIFLYDVLDKPFHRLKFPLKKN